MSSDYEACTERARRQAETMGIDIDAVREIDSDADGVTVRVLLHDAEREVDQVGFDVTRPPGEFGDQLFSEQLQKGLRKLRDYEPGDGSTTDTAAETTADDHTGHEPAPTTSTHDETTQHRVGEFDLTVRMGEESLVDLQTELADAVEDIVDDTVDADRVDELEATVESIDERLQRIEETLATLGSSAD